MGPIEWIKGINAVKLWWLWAAVVGGAVNLLIYTFLNEKGWVSHMPQAVQVSGASAVFALALIATITLQKRIGDSKDKRAAESLILKKLEELSVQEKFILAQIANSGTPIYHAYQPTSSINLLMEWELIVEVPGGNILNKDGTRRFGVAPVYYVPDFVWEKIKSRTPAWLEMVEGKKLIRPSISTYCLDMVELKRNRSSPRVIKARLALLFNARKKGTIACRVFGIEPHGKVIEGKLMTSNPIELKPVIEIEAKFSSAIVDMWITLHNEANEL